MDPRSTAGFANCGASTVRTSPTAPRDRRLNGTGRRIVVIATYQRGRAPTRTIHSPTSSAWTARGGAGSARWTLSRRRAGFGALTGSQDFNLIQMRRQLPSRGPRGDGRRDLTVLHGRSRYWGTRPRPAAGPTSPAGGAGDDSFAGEPGGGLNGDGQARSSSLSWRERRNRVGHITSSAAGSSCNGWRPRLSGDGTGGWARPPWPTDADATGGGVGDQASGAGPTTAAPLGPSHLGHGVAPDARVRSPPVPIVATSEWSKAPGAPRTRTRCNVAPTTSGHRQLRHRQRAPSAGGSPRVRLAYVRAGGGHRPVSVPVVGEPCGATDLRANRAVRERVLLDARCRHIVNDDCLRLGQDVVVKRETPANERELHGRLKGRRSRQSGLRDGAGTATAGVEYCTVAGRSTSAGSTTRGDGADPGDTVKRARDLLREPERPFRCTCPKQGQGTIGQRRGGLRLRRGVRTDHPTRPSPPHGHPGPPRGDGDGDWATADGTARGSGLRGGLGTPTFNPAKPRRRSLP